MQNINSDTKVINSIEKVRIPGRKGREREPEIQKESAGKYSDFCLIFCKKQPMKHFIPTLKEKSAGQQNPSISQLKQNRFLCKRRKQEETQELPLPSSGESLLLAMG
jgi:hypothetical protein